jgi:hypothetical protein
MIQISIANVDTIDLFATATDLNTAQPTIVLSNARINAGNNVPVSVQEDGNGNCLINIVTVNTADPTRTKTFNNQSCSAGQTISVDLFGT